MKRCPNCGNEYSDEFIRCEDCDEELPDVKPAGVYVKKADISKEMMSSAVTFTFFGVLLMVFMLLNAVEIFTWFSNTFSLIVLAALGVGCMVIGINSVGRAKRAAAEAVDEENTTREVLAWLEQTITPDFVQTADDADSSPEINYLKRIEAIKNSVTNQFGDLDDAYIDSIIEDFYNEHFDNV